MITRTAILLAAALVCCGCLTMETTHTITIESDGTVTWGILGTDIRSDGRTATERDREELEFVDDVTALEHGHAAGLAALEPIWVDARLLRDRRPLAVWTEARFESIDALARRFFDQLGCEADITLERDRDVWHLNVQVPTESTSEDVGEVFALMDGEAYRIVLAQGQFVSAIGFEILAGGQVAVPSGASETWHEPEDAIVRFALSWTEAQ